MIGIEEFSNTRLTGKRDTLVVGGSALLLASAAYLWRLYLLRLRYFDKDELEHLHAAWCVSKGLLPYRDFFEHHTPWLHFFLAQFFRFFTVDTKFADAQTFIFLARTWMWIFAGLILLLTFYLGSFWRDARSGCVAALFLGNTLMFLEKTIEVRPDVPSVALWLGCVLAVLVGMREERSGGRARLLFALSGISFGGGLMCTQKLLFALPGFGLAMLWYVLDPRAPGARGRRLANVVFQAVGLCLPVVLTIGYFAMRGALNEFVEYNVLVNLHWKYRFTPTFYLKQLVRDNPIIVVLAVWGLLRALWTIFTSKRFLGRETVYVLSALGLFAGLFIIQVPWRQYYLMFLPFAAVFAAEAFLETIDWIAAALTREQRSRLRFALYMLAGTAALLGFVIVSLKFSRPQFLNNLMDGHDWMPRPFHAELWFLAVVLTAAFLSVRRKNVATVVLLAALSIYPFKIMLISGGTSYRLDDYTNRTTLNQIRYVLDSTLPTDTCLDGWTGAGVFRPHAWFFWFLNSEGRALLTQESKNQLAARLTSGDIAPKLVFYDQDLKGLTETARIFETRYEATAEPPILRRK
jgi:hypothetical protein